ncbi:MAG TPA: lipoyl synthase [Armatimonadota bacterium]|nr:lipoyl synthase [Armatimonadota bacterium]
MLIESQSLMTPPRRLDPKPAWLKVRMPGGPNYIQLKQLVRDRNLHTVCESARCPNIGDCWERRSATFMILGDICTRSCGFCAVSTGRPTGLDPDEPRRVAESILSLGLRHAVITSVARDELPDGGSAIFAATIREVRALCPETSVEVLIPDFKGERAPLETVMSARPDILNHNIETVERLQKLLRPQARYDRSLAVLRTAAEIQPDILTKSGVMLGVGERRDEALTTFRDLRAAGCSILTIGQYLRPSAQHIPVVRYLAPEEFEELGDRAREMGFRHVESGPLVRSSYHADEQISRASHTGAEARATMVSTTQAETRR